MRRLIVATALAAAATASCRRAARPAAEPPAARRTLTPREIADLALPSVVLIQRSEGLGTGFVIWQDGRIATNLHVIAGASHLVVTTSDGQKYEDIEVLAAEADHDLAIIRVRGVRGWPALALGDSDAVRPGDHVVAIGHPLGLGNTVSDGLVSAVRTIDPEHTVIQISAPITSGSSGGPLFNDYGEVIGIASFYAIEGQNLNFGWPVKYLKPMLLAERPISLEQFAHLTSAPARRRPTVPNHSPSLLDGCAPDQVQLVVDAIADAISVGAPLYNRGDARGCFEVYERTALELVARVKGCDGVKRALQDGVTHAGVAASWNDKAWAMRDTFDGILELVVRIGVTPR